MKVTIAEMIDRWSICKLKIERVNGLSLNEFNELDIELNKEQAKHPTLNFENMKKILYTINDNIWVCEAGLKSGKEKLPNPYYIYDKDNHEGLRTMGITTEMARRFNDIRVKFKNFINQSANEGFIEVKKDHCSE